MSGLVVGFRTSRRNLRRNRGRNALIATMVALPVIALVTLAVTEASKRPPADELIAAELGHATARLERVAGDTVPVIQRPTGNPIDWAAVDQTAYEPPQPGAPLSRDTPGADGALALSELGAEVQTAGADLLMTTVVGESWDPLLDGRYELTSGRAPAAGDEALLSPAAATRLRVGAGDEVRVNGVPVTVVGTLAQPRDPSERIFIPAGVIDLAGLEFTTNWYLRDRPLSWDDVLRLNEQGVIAYSAEVLKDLPAVDPYAAAWGEVSNYAENPLPIVAVGGGLVAILLAGSAFAVGIRRDQRMLGLVAVTGGDRRHVVAISVATGIWLGLLGGVGGAGFGIGLAWLLEAASRRGVMNGGDGLYDTVLFWGFHVPWNQVAGSVIFAAAVGFFAALVPALSASKRDPLAALKGAFVPRTPSTRWGIVGAVAMAAGVAALVGARIGLTQQLATPGSWRTGVAIVWPGVMVLGAALAFTGVILAVPHALGWLARVCGRALLGVRLAVRDSARQYVRTGSAIAAIGVTTMAVVFTTSFVMQYANAQESQHLGGSPDGTIRADLLTWSNDGLSLLDGAVFSSAVGELATDANVTTVPTIPDAGSDSYLGGIPEVGVTLAPPLANRCPAYGWLDASDDREQISQAQVARDIRCVIWERQLGSIGAIGHVVVGGAAQLEALLGAPPSSEALAALDAGDAVALTPAWVEDGTVTLELWEDGLSRASTTNPPAATRVINAFVEQPASPIEPFGIVISPSTAKELGVEAQPSTLIASVPGGFSATDYEHLSSALNAKGDYFVIFPGPFPDANLQFLAGIAIALLVLTMAAAAVSTGLARADARADESTLMSVGASPGITRRIAMWQSALTAELAALVGIALGLATAWSAAPATPAAGFVVPWALIAFASLGLPAVVGLGALVLTRSAAPAAYRLAA